MFNQLLVPLDRSLLAECALPHAVTLARVFGSRMILLHVLASHPNSGQGHAVNPLEWTLKKHEVETYLNSIVDRLRSTGIVAESIVLEGHPEESIVEFARHQAIDLIALSSHGAGGLSGWNVNSTAYKVSLRSNRSVLLVRACLPESARQEASHYQRILVPLDGSIRSTYALPLATQLAQALDAEIILAHVMRRPELTVFIQAGHDTVELTEQLMELNRQQATAFLERQQREHAPTADLRLLDSDDVAYALHELVADEKVDLVVMSAHGASGQARWPFGSVAISFLLYGTTPLLIAQDLLPGQFEPTFTELLVQEHSPSQEVRTRPQSP